GRGTDVEDIYPLSAMQHGMLFHTLYTPGIGKFCEQLSCNLQGQVNVSAFKQAWERVVGEYTILRTEFHWERLDEPVQMVKKTVSLSWVEQDWRELSAYEQQQRQEQYLEEDRTQGFNLSAAPLMKLALLRRSQESYQFIWSHHHVLMDGWSV